MDDITEIEKISYGVLSPEEIRNMSVCEITNSRLNSAKNNADIIISENDILSEENIRTKYGTVYDERLGTIESKSKCITCGLLGRFCQGHFGHINLPIPVVHPLFKDTVCAFLNILCINCNRIKFTEEVISLKRYDVFKGYTRFLKLKMDKENFCYHCQTFGDDIKISKTTENICIEYIDRTTKKKQQDDIDPETISKIFNNIIDEDLILMGIVPERIHPRNLVLTVIPVLPISARPPVYTDDRICDDDITTKYIEIIKIINVLEDNKISLTKRSENITKLSYNISLLFSNSQNKVKHSSNNKPVKSIASRLPAKEGLIRLNLMGKRCNQSARTVIGPDPTLKNDEVGIPKKIANILTYPVMVTDYNISQLEKLVNENRVKRIISHTITESGEKKKKVLNVEYALNIKGTMLKHGDKIIRNSEEIFIKNPNTFKLIEGDSLYREGEQIPVKYPTKRHISLQLGDIVERYLIDGDIVLINRQPTLWKGSMLAMKCRIFDQKSMTFNLAVCKGLNGDFDGKYFNE